MFLSSLQVGNDPSLHCQIHYAMPVEEDFAIPAGNVSGMSVGMNPAIPVGNVSEMSVGMNLAIPVGNVSEMSVGMNLAIPAGNVSEISAGRDLLMPAWKRETGHSLYDLVAGMNWLCFHAAVCRW